jgi:hypothetical protein
VGSRCRKSVDHTHSEEYTVVDAFVVHCRNLIVLPVWIHGRVPRLASVHAVAEYQ